MSILCAVRWKTKSYSFTQKAPCLSGCFFYVFSPYREIKPIILNSSESGSAFAEYNRAAYIPNTSELGQKRLNILWDARGNGNRARTYLPIGVKIENLSMERYLLRPGLELEDVLITPATKIRKEYHDFIVNVERMTREVKEIKEAGKDKNTLKNSQIAMVKKSAGNQGKEQ